MRILRPAPASVSAAVATALVALGAAGLLAPAASGATASGATATDATATDARTAAVALASASVETAAPTETSTDSPAPAETAPPVTWSVSPADENGPNKRSWAELELDPGETATDHLAIRNLGAVEATFSISAADGYFTDKGRFNMLASDEESVDAGTWITVADTVTVGPNESVVLPYTVTVPELAEPGDHAAGIAASVTSVQSDGAGTSVGVESRVGFRVMTRVTGELAPAASLAGIDSSYDLNWNPFAPGDLTVSFDVVNEGNARFTVGGTTSAGGVDVDYPATDAGTQELLPGDTRRLTVDVDGVWPLVAVPVDIQLTPTVVTPDGSTLVAASVTESVVVWAVPWPQLFVLLGVALILIAIFWTRIRSRRRLAVMLAEARAEGRRAAETAPVA